MYSILDEIKKIRGDSPIIIDNNIQNRYCVITKEPDQSRTAYCFGSPIYNNGLHEIVDRRFKAGRECFYAIGSNAEIKIGDEIFMKNAMGHCSLKLSGKATQLSEYELECGNDRISLTSNGILYRAEINDNTEITFKLEAGSPFMNIRANNKYFSLLYEKFRPFVTLSSIGIEDANGDIVAPVKIVYQRDNDRMHTITFIHNSNIGKYITFEMNLHDWKLFEDTTVESYDKYENNSFGTTAFIGKTEEFGEQWLYIRPEISRIQELFFQRVNKATLHFPKYNNCDTDIKAFAVASRFCSFGSNWDNKSEAEETALYSSNTQHYHSFDVTNLIADKKTKRLQRSNGIVLRPKERNMPFSVISTGDSCNRPIILEINCNN